MNGGATKSVENSPKSVEYTRLFVLFLLDYQLLGRVGSFMRAAGRGSTVAGLGDIDRHEVGIDRLKDGIDNS